MKRKEFYDTINNIVSDIFPEIKGLNIEVKFINRNNKYIRNKHILGNCQLVQEKRKYIIRVLKNPRVGKDNIMYFNSLNIPKLEGQIIRVLIHEYSHILYDHFITKINKDLYYYIKENRLLNNKFIKMIGKYLDRDDLEYILKEVSLGELFANKIAYMYVPKIMNKFNMIVKNKNYKPKLNFNLNISKEEFRKLVIRSIYKLFPHIENKCNISFIIDKCKDRLIEFYGASHYDKNTDKFNVRIVENPMISDEFKQYIEDINIPLEYGIEVFTILHVISKPIFYYDIKNIDIDLYSYINRDILRHHHVIHTISNLMDDQHERYLVEKNLLFNHIYSDSFSYKYLPIIFNEINNIIESEDNI